MHKTLEARIEANGKVQSLEPVNLLGSHRALVTILDAEVRQSRVRSKYAGAFSSGHSDTSERVDEVLAELGFAQ